MSFFCRYHDPSFLAALEDYYPASLKRMPYEVLSCAIEDRTLNTLDVHIKRALGRRLEADDFLRLPPEEEPLGKRRSAISGVLSDTDFLYLFSWWKDKELYPSVDALLIKPTHGFPFFDQLQKQDLLDRFFDASYWEDSKDILVALSKKSLGKNVLAALRACLTALTSVVRPDESGPAPYRELALEEALFNYATISKKNLKDCVLDSSAAVADLSAFLETKIGRGLMPDDFCDRAHGTVPDEIEGSSILTDEACARCFENLVPVMHASKRTFTACGLLGWNTNVVRNTTPLEALQKAGELEALFDPLLWEVNPSELVRLRDQVEEDDILLFINACVDALALPPAKRKAATKKRSTRKKKPSKPIGAPDVPLTRALVLGHEAGVPSPLRDPDNWAQLAQIQSALGAADGALTWNDLFENALPDGTPLIAAAASSEAWDIVAHEMLPPTKDLSPDVFTLVTSDGASLGSLIAKTGRLLPLLRALGYAGAEIAQASKTLTPDERISNGLDSVLLRFRLHQARKKPKAP
jgi:hypothetical protein